MICFREMKRCSSSISDTSDTSSDTSSDDDAAVDKKRKEDEDLWHHLPFWMEQEPDDAQPDEPMDFFCEGDSSDYDMYDEAADHATWVEWAQQKEKKEVGLL